MQIIVIIIADSIIKCIIADSDYHDRLFIWHPFRSQGAA